MRPASKLTTDLALLGMLACVGMAGVYIYFGQHPASRIVLLNNSGGTVVGIGDAASVTLVRTEKGEVSYSRGRLLLIQTADGKRLSYPFVPVDRAYRRAGDMFVQVEPDYKLYVLPPTTDGVVKELPEQPDGYPLSPQQEGK
jgi:hypothetical protein